VKRRAVVDAFKQFFQGATVRKASLVSSKERAGMERLFFLVMCGEELGIPFLRPYYSLRLLPHLFPRIRPWMRSLLRERYWTDFFANWKSVCAKISNGIPPGKKKAARIQACDLDVSMRLRRTSFKKRAPVPA